MNNYFLLEIGCEEIPANHQVALENGLKTQFEKNLSENKITFSQIKTFSTPRRLAILISGMETRQAPQRTERQGPAFQDAYDKNGTPTLVCLGFAKGCNVSIDQLIVRDTPKGKRLVCTVEKEGAATRDLLPEITVKSIAKLPLSKPMRWGNKNISFIRPVHWVTMLFGSELIDTEILGVKTTRNTIGHRFHCPKSVFISRPEDYHVTLYSQGFVMADRESRKNLIMKSMRALLSEDQQVIIPPDLLDEVTGLVEWPVALKGTFSPEFLKIPKEILISSMQIHQKCFPVINKNQELLPYFILISNIKSKDAATVVAGNERVIHARLSDAAFFYQQDLKKPLIDHLPQLDHVIFQEKLGSVGDKVKRITALSTWIAKKIHADLKSTRLAAMLCKCDLVTDMVREFPNLQGVMGYYYALRAHAPESAAIAITEHYLPKFSGDELPQTPVGLCVALADRADTLIGILGINQLPTGEKDPFALRRAANGIVRILIEKKLDIDLLLLLKESKKLYANALPNKNVAKDAFDFILVRLKSWYLEKGVAAEIFEAVAACAPTSLLDFDRRLKAVLQFQKLPEASSLAAANKRVSNILKKQPRKEFKDANKKLFEFEAEHHLSMQLQALEKTINALYQKADYEKALTELSTLKTPIDQFFNDVMIMVDDEKKKQNRLALLSSIHQLFTKVADISLLP